MASDQSLNIIVRLVDNASTGLKNVGKASDEFAAKVEKLQPAFSKMAVGGTAAFGAITLALKKGSDEINGFQTVTSRLTKIIQTSTGATDAQVQGLIDQAIALESVGVASKESIVNMQAQLATFDLQYDTISKLTPALTDYVIAEKGANATTEDFKALTNGMAQALNGNFASLTKSGFVLDEHTKKMISSGTEMEKAAAVVEVLNGTYEGFNATVAETEEGIKVLKERGFGDLYATLYSKVGPVFEQLDRTIIQITGSMVEWMEANPELTKNLIVGGAAVAALVAGIGLLGLALPAIITGFGAVATALGFILSPIGLIAAGVAALGWAFSTNFMGFRDSVTNAWEVVQPVLVLIWEGFKDTFGKIMAYVNEIKGPLIEIWSEIEPFIVGFLTSLGEWFGSTFGNIVTMIKGAFEIIKGIFDVAFALIAGTVTVFLQLFVGDFSGAWETIKMTAFNAWEGIKLIFSGAFTSIGALFSQFGATLKLTFSALWALLGSVVKVALLKISSDIEAFFLIIGQFFGLGTEALSEVWNGFTGALSSTMTSAWEGIKITIANGINWVIDKINAAIALINKATGTIGGPQIPLVGRVAFQNGGIVPGFQEGGMVGGGSRVPGHHDLVPAMLDPGELILNRAQQKNVAGQLVSDNNTKSGPTFIIQVTGNSFYGSSSSFADEISDSIMEKMQVHMSIPSY